MGRLARKEKENQLATKVRDIQVDAQPAILTLIAIKVQPRYFDTILMLIVPFTDTTVGVIS
jgi:hypothetical protein